MNGGEPFFSNNSERCFVIETGVDVTINGITFTRFYCGEDGGVILNSGTLNIRYCLFDAPTSALNGGAIWTEGSIDIRDTTFDGCLGENGGAVYVGGDGALAYFDNCVFSGCNARESGGAIAAIAAIAAIGEYTDLILVVCEIADGYAMWRGGAIHMARSYVSLSDCYIHNNWSTGDGGGICNYLGSLTVAVSDITNNWASYPDMENFQYHGGGLYLDGSLSGDPAQFYSNTPDDVYEP